MQFRKLLLKTPYAAFDGGVEPHTLVAGEAKDGGNCARIERDPDGGFDVIGPDGEDYWVPNENVIGGRKLKTVLETPFERPAKKVKAA